MKLDKMSKNISLINIKYLLYFSLIVQVITTIITWNGMSIKLNEEDKILNSILTYENVVQIIEAIVYFWIIYGFTNLNTVINKRYIDWFITTPLMLFSSLLFFKYQDYKENNINEPFTIKSFINDNKEDIILIFIYNALMLLFGYLAERDSKNRTLYIFIGFIFFGLSFNVIYKYAKKSVLGKKLFYILILLWSLYGFSAFFNLKIKNINYTILDIFSKNFYGLYIYYRIKKLKDENNNVNHNGIKYDKFN